MQDAVDAGRRAATPTCCASNSSSGDEVTCPVLGTRRRRRALPVIRIVAPEGNYDYQNKYFTDDTKYLVPSGLPEGEEAGDPGASCCKAYRVLGCRGWGRVDVMIDAPATASPTCWRSTPRPA